MSLLTTVPNASEIQRNSKEICMAIEDYLSETKSICNKNCEEPNHGDCDLSNTVQLLSGAGDYRSGWTREDLPKGNERKNAELSIAACTQSFFLVFQPQMNLIK
jgi:hypothetical protein